MKIWWRRINFDSSIEKSGGEQRRRNAISANIEFASKSSAGWKICEFGRSHGHCKSALTAADKLKTVPIARMEYRPPQSELGVFPVIKN
jgi:hypothetical protein